MPAAQQFAADNDGGLDIAATPVARQHKFHRGFCPCQLSCVVVPVGNVPSIGHYAWSFDCELGV
ncbi:hypothetical protein, partial [Mycobacterium sp.]